MESQTWGRADTGHRGGSDGGHRRELCGCRWVLQNPAERRDVKGPCIIPTSPQANSLVKITQGPRILYLEGASEYSVHFTDVEIIVYVSFNIMADITVW